jgi:hypothetical protein
VINNSFLIWKQAALFQAAARDILADAAVSSLQQLRNTTGSRSRTVVACRVMREWRGVICKVAHLRSRASTLNALALYGIVKRAYRQWSFACLRITRIRQLAMRFIVAAGYRRLLTVMFTWRQWSINKKTMSEYLATRRLHVLRACFRALADFAAFCCKMKAISCDVFALTRRTMLGLLAKMMGAWRILVGRRRFFTLSWIVKR